jgi:hypothetical protein
MIRTAKGQPKRGFGGISRFQFDRRSPRATTHGELNQKPTQERL